MSTFDFSRPPKAGSYITIQKKAKHMWETALLQLRQLLRWCLLSLLIGAFVGLIGAAFVYCIHEGTALRIAHPWLLLFLPFGGILIVWLYHVSHDEHDKGTNMVIASLHSEAKLPAQMAPLIFVSTVITHLFGGSAGREGAALQLGGSIGNLFGQLFRMRKRDVRILILAGMSAAFSAIFGTPISAVVFAMEVSCIGAMRYSALVPCTVASLTASYAAGRLGITAEHYTISFIPELSPVTALQTVLLGICCAAVSILFCTLLHRTERTMKRLIPNAYLRISAAGVMLLLLGLIFQSYDYFGIGSDVIERAIAGEAVWYAFLAKMLFTAVTLGGGYKGGEIVPTFFIGATFGCLFGTIVGLSPSLCAAVGMVALFCSVTNCPLASLFIAAELFGMDAVPYCLLVVAVSYLLSGYHGLYREQRFLYSKFADVHVQHRTKH